MAAWTGVIVAAVLLTAGGASRADGPILLALTEDGTLLRFSADRPGDVTTGRVTGVSGLVGLDRRPANGLVYGLTDGGDVCRVDPASGAATVVSTLTAPFNGGPRSGLDFNPKTDRLRLVGADGQNLRVNVDNGATAVDRPLAFDRKDPHFGEAPAIAGTAYTNNLAAADTTDMFDLDTGHDLLLKQDPPNDGVLTTVGPLGVHVPAHAGFDIVTDGSGKNRGFAAFSSTLYEVDLATGAAKSLGAIGGPSGSIVGLTALGNP